MTSKILLCLLLSSSLVRANVIRSSSSSGAGTANQTCGTDNINFYCPVDRLCKPRSQRCTHANVCNNPDTNTEDGCYETSISGLYNIQLGHAKLGFSGSKQYALEHQFILYRGFAYEFGKSYGVQILDTADPQYKYRNGMHLNSKGIEIIGSGYCTWEDATSFANGWNKRYSFFFRNCQHFAIALEEFLTTGVCSVPISNRVKREDRTADLNQQINDILQNCSIVCCDNEGNSVVSMSPIMIFIIFSIILVVAII